MTPRELIDCIEGMTDEERQELGVALVACLAKVQLLSPEDYLFPPSGLELNQQFHRSLTGEQEERLARVCQTSRP